MVVGAISGYDNGLLLDRRLPEPDQDTVLAALSRALGDRVRQRGLTGALFCYPPVDAIRQWRQVIGSVTPVAARPNTTIELPGDTFGDYLAAVETRRREISREIRRFEAAGYAVRVEPLIDVHQEAWRLLLNVEAKHGNHRSSEGVELTVRRQAEELGPAALVFGARRAGRLVAMALCCVWDGCLYARSVGFDYDALSDAFEYFNLCYYQPIAYAYEHGLRRVSCGVNTYDVKIRRGATVAPRFSIVLHGPQPSAEGAVAAAEAMAVAQRLPTHDLLGAEVADIWGAGMRR